MGELARRIERTQVGDASPKAQHREKDNRVERRVRQIKRNRLAFADAGLGKARREFRHEPAEGGIIKPRLAIGKGRPSRPFGDREVEKRGQGADLDRSIPARRLRKGIDPGAIRRGAHPSSGLDFSEIGEPMEFFVPSSQVRAFVAPAS